MQMAATTKLPRADSSPTLPGRMLNLRRDESESGICGDSNLEEFTILQENYAVLCNTMTDIDDLLKYFVAEKIITLNEEEEIKSSATKSDKVQKLLLNISDLLKAGNNNGFYIMLKIMKDRGTKATQNLATLLSSRITTKDETLPEHFESIDIIVETARNELCKRYTQSRYIPSTDDWPPYHPKYYTPLTIVHHEGRCTESEVIRTAEEMALSKMATDKQYYNKAIRDINSLFAQFDGTTPAPYIILIEGAPGIGKTILSKEISLQWADKRVLRNKKILFLLFMRDPQVKQIRDIPSLVKYFHLGASVTAKFPDWLIKTSGRYLTLLLDGYDEASVDNNFIINDIIGRKVLTECGLIITSRPAASSHLHSIVHCRAEVLGFTQEDRLNFIENALQNDNDKIENLQEFFQTNPFLNTLCYIPLNMSILLCLAEGGINTLPTTQTSLYQKFIVITIIHFLKKNQEIITTDITSLNDLPSPYHQIVNELSKFAFLALQKDQLVFTKAEVNITCPNLTPANWHALGLLKPAQYFKPEDGCDHESFHFLHFSIQEYMAAYHIASLPNADLLQLLNDTFWNIRYFNTWAIYVGITGGNDFGFKHFLSGNYLQFSSWLSGAPSISRKLLKDKMKCLNLLYCLTEADCKILSSVESIFKEGTLDFSKQSLSLNDVRTLAILLLRLSNRQWKIFDLSGCSIGDEGCDILCETLQCKHSLFQIKTVDLSCNNISWESLNKFCNVLKSWHVKEFIFSIDMLCDREKVRIKNSTKTIILKSLDRNPLFTGFLLVTFLQRQNKVIAVYSSPRYIKSTQFGANRMIPGLRDFVGSSPLTAPLTAVSFVYHQPVEDVNTKLATISSHIDCVKICGTKLHSKGAYLLNNVTIIESEYSSRHQQLADYLSAVMCHNILTNTSYLGSLPTEHVVKVKNRFQSISNVPIFDISYNNIGVEAADDIATVLSHNTKLQELYLAGNSLQTEGAIKISRGLQNTSTLTVLYVSNNNIGVEAADDIATVLSHNTKLQTIELGNNLLAAGGIKIFKSLRFTSTLTSFGISNNNIGVEAADDIATVLSHNTKLQKLGLAGNSLQTEGAIKISRGLQNTSTLIVLHISNNNIGVEAADDIATVLSHNTKLQELHLAGNNLQTEGAIKISRGLQNTSTLTVLYISNNNIGVEAADDIATVLSHNTKLQTIELGNNLLAAGGIKISRGLQNTSTLTVLYISNNNIGVEAADDIATVLSHNTKLQTIELGNNLLAAGGIKIFKSLQFTSTLTSFGISDNNIGVEAADDIATVLSHNTKLQQLYLAGNNLQTEGAIKISRGLQNTSTLTELNISNNSIGVEGADDIATVLSHNTKLQKLGLAGNSLQTEGAIKISRGLQNTSTLTDLYISNNNINIEARNDIKTALSQNTNLKVLKL
ncbi:NACHT, LRR and PYD domains-containing protein 12-like isoform X2 [Dysidea avara]|uniref:NACHT, LRR and PYD domains-containing protein 12-like isoform X2 n=1 Tax=Dysidea avara TaxID=196820 RepID=UPI003331CAE8